ncbi:hypothetical protein GCM10017688_56510 [Streptomyces ramulosus]
MGGARAEEGQGEARAGHTRRDKEGRCLAGATVSAVAGAHAIAFRAAVELSVPPPRSGRPGSGTASTGAMERVFGGKVAGLTGRHKPV